MPVIITEPAVGYGGGLVGMFLRPRKQAGEQGWARPNISAIGAIGTENGTRAAFAGDASRSLDGRVKTLAGVGGGHINLDFYGLGANRASLDEAIRYSLDFQLLFLQGTWQLTPRSPWSIRLRYIYSQVEPKLRDEPVFPGLADRADGDISAPAAILEFDSRDNVFTPTRGTTIIDPQAARLAMRKMFPDLSVGYVTRGTVVKDTTGKRIPVSWQWIEK